MGQLDQKVALVTGGAHGFDLRIILHQRELAGLARPASSRWWRMMRKSKPCAPPVTRATFWSSWPMFTSSPIKEYDLSGSDNAGGDQGLVGRHRFTRSLAGI